VHLVGPGDERLEADLVVAADGIDSATRAALFPGHPSPVYTGVTAWRFVAPAPPGLEPAETWGRGSIVGIAPLADGRAYCYATAVLPEGTRFADDATELRRRFGAWHAPIPELLAPLGPGDVLHHDLRWLATPLPRYDVGGVVFVGDAAHAMPPNLGQGGCQALEDAVVLGFEVGRAGAARDAAGPGVDLPVALAAYTAARLARTTRIARLSARAGAPTAWTSPVATWLREQATRVVGRVAAPMLVRRMEPIVGWLPPGDRPS
jgi:2-polyprenyl-6-methoxyphenol hydroxylase-like FAD-dependent oxidoreductase